MVPDTPLALFNSYGAWTDPRIVDDYFNYATFVISRYDEHVPIWYTFNEREYSSEKVSLPNSLIPFSSILQLAIRILSSR